MHSSFSSYTASRDEAEPADLPPLLFQDTDPLSLAFVDNDEARTYNMGDEHNM
ncbi:hypothetical protein NW759_010202 [Fusarium solani]|nr:hypothetical protein NW759_010202 [Fusarium solani]